MFVDYSMSSRRKRTTNRTVCPPEVIEEARKRVAEGESKRSVAKSLGMAESSLRVRLNRSHSVTSLGRYDTTFTKEVENEFCEYLKKLDDMFFGMTAKDLRVLAYEYAEKNKIPHRFNPETKIAGKEWLRGFMKRHPDISLRQPTSTSIARAMGFNMPQCERFFINLTVLMDKHNFPPNAIYNMDETGISTVPNNPPKVISTKGKRAVNKISSAERGTNVTIVSAMSPVGHFVPPVFIFGRKRMKAELLDGAPPGSVAMVSDSSFINSDLFLQWLSHFKYHTKPTKENPVLLLLDNHSSHTTIGAVDFYRENNIIALTLPPHSSHKLQPLDRGFHSALKKYYSNECEKWLRNHPGRAITVFQMATIFTPAFYKAATPACAADSFRTTGIWPYNPDVFSEADFLASAVTEREHEANDSTVERGSQSTTDTLLQNSSPQHVNVTPREIVVQEAEVDISAPQSSTVACDDEGVVVNEQLNAKSKDGNSTPQKNEKLNIQPIQSQTQSIEPVPGCSKETFKINISDISPLPKSQVKRSFTKKHKKSEIISGSPYKADLEKQIEERNQPKVKKLKIDAAVSTKKSSSKAGKAKLQPKTIKKKNIKPKTKSGYKRGWKCPGCEEIYKEPIVEDWIECSECKEWWHEKCTAYSCSGCFVCDLCQD